MPIQSERSTVTPQSFSGAAAVVKQMRAERRRFVLLRLSFAAVLALAAMSLAWAIPWIPVGMAVRDYDSATSVLVIFMAASCSSLIAFHAIWWPAFRQEPIHEFLRVLLGGRQLIRGERQFRSRLAAECRRARRDRRGRVFSVVVIGVEENEPCSRNGDTRCEEERHLLALIVRNTVRAADVVGDFWPGEVWTLSLGAGDMARQGIVRRLARALADDPASHGHSDGACIGSATFGQDGCELEELLSAARARLLPLAEVVEPSRAA